MQRSEIEQKPQGKNKKSRELVAEGEAFHQEKRAKEIIEKIRAVTIGLAEKNGIRHSKSYPCNPAIRVVNPSQELSENTFHH